MTRTRMIPRKPATIPAIPIPATTAEGTTVAARIRAATMVVAAATGSEAGLSACDLHCLQVSPKSNSN